ncbi:hypothetical protein BGS_0983 [Beggiatoa sp. SS]|nr:hypothetical protein BGS_0983 [Beggiatoa sp. SS]
MIAVSEAKFTVLEEATHLTTISDFATQSANQFHPLHGCPEYKHPTNSKSLIIPSF